MITFKKSLDSGDEELTLVLNEHFIPDKETLLALSQESRSFHDQDEKCHPLGLSQTGDGLTGLGLLKIGKCLPHACSDQDIRNGASNFLIDLLGDQVISRGMTLSCHATDDKIEWEAGDWTMIGVLAFFGVLLFIGTLFDVGINVFEMKELPKNLLPAVQGFSIYTNVRKILNTGSGGSDPNSLGCINGLKYISISWIVLGHTLWEYCNVSGYNAFTNSAVATGKTEFNQTQVNLSLIGT